MNLNLLNFRGDGLKSSLLLKEIIHYLFLIVSVFISWNYFGLGFLYFLYFFLRHCESVKRIKFELFFLKSFLLLLIWHIGAVFWMVKIDYGFYGLIVNVFYYLIPFIVFYILRNVTNKNLFLIIPIWTIFEYMLDVSNFSYPWLTIGNSLSNSIEIIQWYKYTGVLGGSIWLLITAFFLYKRQIKKMLFLLLFPITFSLVDYSKEIILCDDYEYFIVFNNEIYNQKEKYLNNDKLAFHICKKIKLLKEIKESNLILPEQTLRAFNYQKIDNSLPIDYLKKLINENSIKSIYVGVAGMVNDSQMANSIILLDKTNQFLKVKKKLVPYTEYLPKITKTFFNKITYEYNVKDSLSNIKFKNKTLPIICYESIYSSYVAENSKETNLICLLTSESFFNHSFFGKKQYNNIIGLRALENNLQIVKASNSGLSFLMNQKGKVISYGNKEINIFKVFKQKKAERTFFVDFTNRYLLHIIFILFITILYYSIKL